MALQQQHDTNLLWQNLESLQVHCFLSVPAYFVLASVFHHMDSYSLFFQKKIELETRLLWPNQIKASALLSHQHVMCNHSVWKWFCFISNNFLLLTKKKTQQLQHKIHQPIHQNLTFHLSSWELDSYALFAFSEYQNFLA